MDRSKGPAGPAGPEHARESDRRVEKRMMVLRGVPRVPQKMERQLRSRLELATAVARQRLLDTHVSKAVELVQLSAGRLEPVQALRVYGRIHRLSTDEAEIVRNRALVALAGERPDDALEVSPPPRPRDAGWRGLLRRLLGRVGLERRDDETLRHWIDLHSGKTEAALTVAHVANALRFVDILGRETESSVVEAVARYSEAMDLRDATAEMVANFALAWLSYEQLPVPGGSSALRAPGEAGMSRLPRQFLLPLLRAERTGRVG